MEAVSNAAASRSRSASSIEDSGMWSWTDWDLRGRNGLGFIDALVEKEVIPEVRIELSWIEGAGDFRERPFCFCHERLSALLRSSFWLAFSRRAGYYGN